MKIKVDYKRTRRVKIDIKIKEERKMNYKALICLALALALIINLPVLLAYEAHIINVTARICFKSETRTIGYWKNHLEVAEPYFPILLGDSLVENGNNAFVIFENANAKDMAVKLRAQLLAMKLNIKHFGIGDYWVESYGTDLYGLTAIADQLLISGAPREEMEAVKNALDGINNMHLLRVCLDRNMLPQVRVDVPNGGEEWEIGSGQTIEWTATNPEGDDNDLLIDIWYCDNGGNDCLYNIIQGTGNDGEYLWPIPTNQGLDINNFDYKIKIIAIDSANPLRTGHDKSDENFAFLPEPEPEVLFESLLDTGTDSGQESFEGIIDTETNSGEDTFPEPASVTDIETSSNEETFEDKDNKGKKDNPPGQEPELPLESIIQVETQSNEE